MKITIKNPCSIDLDRQPAVSTGWACSACQKEVVDFRAYSETGLSQYFLIHGTSNLCGRFLARQLHTVSHLELDSSSDFDELVDIPEDPDLTWEDEVGGDIVVAPEDPVPIWGESMSGFIEYDDSYKIVEDDRGIVIYEDESVENEETPIVLDVENAI